MVSPVAYVLHISRRCMRHTYVHHMYMHWSSLVYTCLTPYLNCNVTASLLISGSGAASRPLLLKLGSALSAWTSVAGSPRSPPPRNQLIWIGRSAQRLWSWSKHLSIRRHASSQLVYVCKLKCWSTSHTSWSWYDWQAVWDAASQVRKPRRSLRLLKDPSAACQEKLYGI